MIRWARERLGDTMAEFAKRMDVKEMRVVAWENGDAFMTYNQIKRLADQSLLPVGLLFLESPPNLSLGLADFRSFENKTSASRAPSPELYAVVSSMKYRQGWYREYLKENGCEPLSYVGSLTLRSPVGDAVGILHEVLQWDDEAVNLCKDWESYFDKLTTAMEDVAGILVMRNSVVENNTSRRLNLHEFRGFALSDEYAPLVFVNAADSKGAQLFTLVHEAVHILLNEGGISNNNLAENVHAHAVERYCNAVAGEFLVEEKALKAHWAEVSSREKDWLKRLSDLSRQFKLSRQVILHRCQSLDLIPQPVAQFLWTELKKAEAARITSGKGNFYAILKNRVSRLFARMVIAENESGNISFTDAFRLLSVNSPEALRKLSVAVGG